MSDSNLRLPGRIAVFAVAHAKYWAQFPTLRGKLEEYHNELCKKLTVKIMKTDFSWTASAEKYLALYESLG